MAMGSAQPLTLPRISPGSKGDRCIGLTILLFSCVDCLEILLSPTLLKPSGLVQACRVIALSIFVTSILHQDQDIKLCISNPNILAQESKFEVLRIYVCSNTS